MPPKAAAAATNVAASVATTARPPSPGPPSPPANANDLNDILLIQDFMDTIDQIPVELTRVHSDLNELGAVLYSTLCNLERKLYQLIEWIQDPTIGAEQRFQLLQDIAEEAARYKLGGDDKIRVAGGACDGIMAHQRHIQNLLDASTLLDRDPPSPYTVALTMPHISAPTTTRRGNRTAGSPSRDGGGTPTKRKKNRGAATKDDDDASSINGGKDDKKKAPVKRKKANRAASPSESVASTSGYGKPSEPVARTARQIAAAAAKARAAQRAAQAAEDSDDESGADDEPKRAQKDDAKEGSALGIDLGSREDSASKSNGATPAVSGSEKARSRGSRGVKRSRGDDEEEDEEDDGDEEDTRPAKRSGTSTAKKDKVVDNAAATNDESVEQVDTDGGGGDGDVDSRVYCTCQKIGYGEMIGCDDDDCEIEWYHVSCLNLDKAPEGNWICPQCIERRKRNPKPKKANKGGKRK